MHGRGVGGVARKDRAQGQACAVQKSGRATFYRVATVPGRGREEGHPKLPTMTGPLNFRSLFPMRGAPGIPEDTHRARNRAGVGETDLFHRSRRMTSHRRSRKTRRQQNKASRQKLCNAIRTRVGGILRQRHPLPSGRPSSRCPYWCQTCKPASWDRFQGRSTFP